MRVVTWNVNSLKVRLPRVLQLLEQHAPDVVCLQETKSNPDAFPAPALADAGYQAVHASGGRWAGVAILARAGTDVSANPDANPDADADANPDAGASANPDANPDIGADANPDADRRLIDAGYGLPEDPVPDEARWCEASVGGVRFASVYVPNGRTLDSPEFPRKLAFLDAMAARIRRLSADGTPVIVCGDMNIAPADADVYDPAAFTGGTHVSAPERERLRAILDGGMVDAFRAVHPDTVQYTWWDYRAGNFHKGLGLRIDLALVSEPLAGRLTECGIDRDYRKGTKPSDHAPLLIDLRD